MAANNDRSAAASGADIAQTLGIVHTKDKGRHYLKLGSILAAIIVIVIAGLQWFGNGESQAVRYSTSEVTRGKLTVAVTATGTLQPVNQVDVGSEISGTIETVMVDYNDRVEQGQVLATMNTDQLQAKVNQAMASLELAKAQVKQSEATIIETRNKLRRANLLAKSGTCSQEECDAAQASYDRAVAELARSNAQVAQAQASLNAEQTTLAKATLLSPIDGIVLNRDVEPGQTVAASFQTPVLFTLAENLTQMELHVDVDEADVGQVKVGQDAEFTVDAYPSDSFPAKITEVHFASQTVDGVVTYETVLGVDNSALLLRPGMTATADIMVKQVEGALLAPNAALRFNPPPPDKQKSSGGGLLRSLLPRPPHPAKNHEVTNNDKKQQQVWTLRNGQAVPITVTTGASDGINTEVRSGDIEPGMLLIVDTINSGK
ncbi:MAG: efflux RND transporter periplasmic adaptor subunit [Gammaproteobacteria bacterium]|nr:efflux RND transporter periplasmic adaptor subunit [Gammaproteobacteria bacterium]